MDRRTVRGIVIGSAAIAALLGAGFATYLFGGAGKPPPELVPQVDLSQPPALDLEPTVVLRLPWGTGDGDVWADPEGSGSTVGRLAVTPDGRILLADHPGWHVGARVRRFSPEGKLEATWMTPPGSTLFEPFGNGIMYVTARGESMSETLRLLSEDGSVEASFPIPAEVNSANLFRAEDRLFVTSEIFMFDDVPAAMRFEPQAVPIVELLAEGPAPVEEQVAVVGAGADTAGRMYRRLLEEDGFNPTEDSTHTITWPDGSMLRVPGMSTPLGVDGDVVWVVMPRSFAPEVAVGRAGWPYALVPEAEVIAASHTGRLIAREIVPWSVFLPDLLPRARVAAGALWLLDADAEGVTVLRYGEVKR